MTVPQILEDIYYFVRLRFLFIVVGHSPPTQVQQILLIEHNLKFVHLSNLPPLSTLCWKHPDCLTQMQSTGKL